MLAVKRNSGYLAADDNSLVAAYVSGDNTALEVLLTRHKAKIYNTILQIARSPEIAQDLYQETVIKIIDVLQSGRYKDEGKFYPWAQKIARNLAIDYFRKSKRKVEVRADDNWAHYEYLYRTDETPDNQLVRKENHKMVRKLINQLPQKQREVLLLRHYNSMSFKEIADTTDVSINTALGRMRYALVNLRKYMDVSQQASL